MAAWTGYGWLGYAFLVGSLVAMIAIVDRIFGAGFASQHPGIVVSLTFVTTSILCFPVGRYFNRHLPLQVFDTDWAKHGRTVAHSTFFVRLEFAALAGLPALLAFGIGGLGNLATPWSP